ncbi:glypican-5 [Trichonephila clavata]|uniref:Glypican-5 n=1 Tax=Trichonephila clavata TaxID=2740835 RepID=A0A8X6K5D1_TRICU|nr:glypican-5 [Trichonephila clavata]
MPILNKPFILNARVTSVPQSDSSVVGEGSGSGAWWKTSDDEDYAQASGSGDTSEDKTDLHFERTDDDVKDKSGSMTSQMSLVLVIFCTLLVLKMK